MKRAASRPMRAMAAITAPTLVRAGGEYVFVHPPTVRQAVEIQAALSGAVAGDPRDEKLFVEVLGGWLPDVVTEALDGMDWTDVARFLTGLINHGLPDDSAKGSRKKSAKKSAASGTPDVMLLLADYCQIYGGDPWTVYTTVAWPFFVHSLSLAGAASARELLRWAEVEILPHTGKKAKETFDSLIRRAEGPDPVRSSDPNEPPHAASMEEVRAARARLRRAWGGG